jgi:hypothetical protein
MRHGNAICSALIISGMITAFSPASAAIIAYTDPANQGISYDYVGNIALQFNVNSPISVTALGVFNAFGDGVINGTVQVVIYNTISNIAVTPVATFHGSYISAGLGYDVFQSINPVILGVGSYEVDEVGLSGLFGNLDYNGNQTHGSSGPVLNNGGGLLTFNGAIYSNLTTLGEPQKNGGSCSGCNPLPSQSSQFDAGTFQYQGASSAVPEPSTWVMMMLGFACLGFAGYRQTKRESGAAVSAA